jgi:hypothetical protein
MQHNEMVALLRLGLASRAQTIRGEIGKLEHNGRYTKFNREWKIDHLRYELEKIEAMTSLLETSWMRPYVHRNEPARPALENAADPRKERA